MKNNVTNVQKYIWLDQMLESESPRYNIGGYASINGSIDVERFKLALTILAKENDIFSFVFEEKSGFPSYTIQEAVPGLGLVYIEESDESKAIHAIKEDFIIPFDFKNDQRLYKMWLLQISPTSYIWYCKLHHIVSDGFSFQLLFNKLNRIYKQLETNTVYDDTLIEKNTYSYENFITSEETYRASEEFSKDRDFWIDRYTDLPSLVYAGTNKTNSHCNVSLVLSKEESESLWAFSKTERLGVFHLLLGCWSIMMSKYYNTSDVNLGMPILNRKNAVEKRTLGPFISLLPLKLSIDTSITVRDFIKEIKSTLFMCFRHQRFQQVDILRNLSQEVSKLYDVRMSYQRMQYETEFSGNQSEIYPLSNDGEEDPISIHIYEALDGQISFRFDINEKYVSRDELDQLIISFKNVLTQLEEIKNLQIAAVEIASKEQLEEIQKISNGPIIERPEETFIDLWNTILHNHTSKTAVTYQATSLTYETLEAHANTIASYLQVKGVKKGSKVGVMVSRSEKSIIGALAALKAGAVYVPIDDTYPVERKQYIIEDAQLEFILTDSSSQTIVEERECNIDTIIESYTGLEKFTPVPLEAQDEAYIIYTSGSTGKPKGVVINHASLYDYIVTFREYFNLNDQDVVLQQASTSFDTSIEEIFPILSIGGNLVIANDTKDFNELLKECEYHKVTLLSTNPFVLQYLNDNYTKYDFDFKTLISGGDVLKPHQIDQLIDTYNVYNTYGPTESTVCATYHKVAKTDTILPIGKPITNRGVYLLDGTKILPKGAIGEIGLSGIGLAVSYLNKKELTDQAFLNINGKRIYKTGDLGKWDANNNLIFYGRKDNQISYKGYRIEVGEIEQAIQQANVYVIDSYVCIKEVKGMPILVAYLVANESFVNIATLVKDLKGYLPEFMIPTHFVIIEAIPLLPNGKIDIKSLPEAVTVNTNKAVVLPSTEEEKEIAAIWEELLKLDEVDVTVSFFELGGHSLLANQFISNLRDQKGIELSLKDFYKSPTIKEISELVPSLDKKEIQNIIAPQQELYPLSYAQDRLWFLNQLDTEDTSYHVSRAIKLTGQVAVDILENTFSKLIEKHEILRTVFVNNEGEPYQKILSPFAFHIPVKDCTDIRDEAKEKVISESLEQLESISFEIEEGPLFRVELLKFSEKESVLLFCEHHLILDGWTQGILFRDFVDIYNELKRNPEFEVKKPEVTFKDYAYWEKESFRESVLNKKLEFWEEKFDGFSNEQLLPLDYNRPITSSKNGGTISHVFSLEFSEKLRRFSEKQHVSLFITMMTAFKIALYKFSDQTDICIGTAVANRRYKEFQEVLGMIVNTIALRTTFNSDHTLMDVLHKVKETCLDAYTHDDTPFGKVVERINPERGLNTHPLFQYMFSFVNVPIQSMSLLDAEIEIIKGHNKASQFDISVVVNTIYEQISDTVNDQLDRRISVEWDYNSDIFMHTTMERILMAYLNILEALIVNPTQSLTTLNYIPESEKEMLLQDFNATSVTYPSHHTIVDLLVSQVENTPNAIALEFNDKKFTYRELDILSNQLANYLLTRFEIEIEDLITVKLERSEWLYIALVAILKTGGAYVPIDPNYPQQRIDFIEEDTKSKVTIHEELILDFLTKQESYSAQLPVVSLDAKNLAYIIYTSGSTGNPKGVMIEHKSLVNYITDQSKAFDFNTSERVLQFSNPAFDASMEQIFLALLNGATLVGVSKDRIMDPVGFTKVLKEYAITHIHATPSYLEHVQGLDSCKHLRRIIAGGEACSKSLAKRLCAVANFYNEYGPTETTISSTMCKVQENHLERDIISIGTPVANTQTYILSDDLSLKPIGVFGELCISGDGLSRGYLHREDLTSEKFVAHPFIEGERLYKTGDIARWLSDGTIEFLGRKDDQVKVRGYRIELGEIEHAIQLQDNINQCVVVVKEVDGDQAIVAYIVSDTAIDKQELRMALSNQLPDYMLPNYYVEIAEIPLTSNGKMDKKSLPSIASNDRIKNTYIAPSTTLEKQLVAIWEEVLGVSKIGLTDNFFELGGHSLKMTLVVNKIKNRLGYDLTIKEMFLNPTIASIVPKLGDRTFDTIPKAALQADYPLTSSQHRLWILSQFEGGNKAYNIPGSFELEGVLDVEKLKEAFNSIIARHEVLRTFFKRNDEGEVRQCVVDALGIDFEMECYDYSEAEDQENALEKRVANSYKYQFDLEEAPLVRLHLIRLSEDRHVLLFNMHHIISDGWSMEVLSKELITIYDHLVQAKEINLPELSIQYKDYASWIGSEAQKAKLEMAEAYWLHTFSGELPVLELPTHKMRPKIKTYVGDSITYDFSKETSTRLKLFSQENNMSLFMVLMTGVNGILSRYTNTNDIIVGTPIAGRDHTDLENQIGLYLNTLAIRTQFEKDATFEELLATQKETLLNAYEHQDYPLDNLVEELGLGRDTSRSGLFDVLVVLQNQQDLFGSGGLEMNGLTLKPYTGYQRKVSQFDISFLFSEKEGQLSLQIEYNTDIYESDFIERLGYHLNNFLQEGMNTPTHSVANLNYLGSSEESQLLYDFNDTQVEYPSTTIVDLFVAQVSKTPNHTALIIGNKQFTYKELDEVSNELAHYLLSNYELSVEDLVGVKLERNEWLLISLLAVLKAGCAYVPLDTNYPAQRIAYIEQDSQCKVTIDQDMIEVFVKAAPISTALPKVTFDAASLAYVIYTSGSTGKPKGVMITHDNASTMLQWSISEFEDTDIEIMYAVTSHCFDLSVYEFFYPLSIGKPIRLLENGLAISDYAATDSNILINTVPSVIQTLIEKEMDFSNVVGINLAGEPFPPSITSYFKDSGIALRNLYGPSEDTTYSSIYHVEKVYNRSVPIGKGIDNTQFYILSDSLALQPVGVVGEICISGDGLSRGYLNQPELTKEKFVFNRFRESGLLYKTGDLGKWLPNGTIEYVGRKDSQVKIRGHRIELGEIEHVLLSQNEIDQCVVMTSKIQDELAIVSYLVSESPVDKQLLRLSLTKELPEYMLPSYYVFLDEMPLTPNGKIDKKALPEVSSNDVIQREYTAPSNEIEEGLVAIWKDVLGVEGIGVTDNFFELGGNSLKATVLVNRINKAYNTRFSIQDLYETQEIMGVSKKLEFIVFQSQLEVDSVDELTI
ncbi:surfactin synthase subunit 1 [Dokdonia pacifica]|uniref:Amino acid adenylation domain-containing protein n=1 Tax=Dokdonia pacifica TaxID=1627892 RepID=A0A238VLZ8_9FLAO|nr:non-ribosomal peptide synthetase [Dokdonia pacifica]GGG20358.1 surfactin synthase subunit 1 [Dokdonia pacifica]SNR35137.1 amino acid adenylation domain-containing protein [Dokdonia pacifica]